MIFQRWKLISILYLCFKNFNIWVAPSSWKGSSISLVLSLGYAPTSLNMSHVCLLMRQEKKMKWTKLEQNSPSVSNEFTNQLSKKFNPTIFKDESQFLKFLMFSFLCWISQVVPFNMWLISTLEERKCCNKLSKCEKW